MLNLLSTLCEVMVFLKKCLVTYILSLFYLGSHIQKFLRELVTKNRPANFHNFTVQTLCECLHQVEFANLLHKISKLPVLDFVEMARLAISNEGKRKIGSWQPDVNIYF